MNTVIEIPEGFIVDKENSTDNKIVLKKKSERWIDIPRRLIKGYYIDNNSRMIDIGCRVIYPDNDNLNRNIFATKKQAESALAMAQISQIIANDKRFGGFITDEEWHENLVKYLIVCYYNDDSFRLAFSYSFNERRFLAFHTQSQAELFLKENEELIRKYYMI